MGSVSQTSTIVLDKQRKFVKDSLIKAYQDYNSGREEKGVPEVEHYMDAW